MKRKCVYFRHSGRNRKATKRETIENFTEQSNVNYSTTKTTGIPQNKETSITGAEKNQRNTKYTTYLLAKIRTNLKLNFVESHRRLVWNAMHRQSGKQKGNPACNNWKFHKTVILFLGTTRLIFTNYLNYTTKLLQFRKMRRRWSPCWKSFRWSKNQRKKKYMQHTYWQRFEQI